MTSKAYIADQAASSSTTVFVTLAIGRTLSRSEFGHFSVLFTIFTISLLARQAVLGDGEVILTSGLSDRAPSGGQWTVLRHSFFIGLGVSAACLAADYALAGRFTALGLGFLLAPLIFVQDALRFEAFARGNARSALLLDALWGALLCAGYATSVLVLNLSATYMVLIWGLAGGVAGLAGLALRPRGEGSKVGGRKPRNLRLYCSLLSQYALGAGAAQATVLYCGAIGALASAGSLRSAQLLFGPLNIFLAGVRTSSLAEYSRGYNNQATFVAGNLKRRTGLLSGAVVFYGLILIIVPGSLGRTMLGDTWIGTRQVVPFLLVQYVFLAGAQNGGTLLLAMRKSREATYIKLVLALGSVVLAPLLVLKIHPAAVAVGLALSTAAMASFFLTHHYVRDLISCGSEANMKNDAAGGGT